jgi:hypothetical protein
MSSELRVRISRRAGPASLRGFRVKHDVGVIAFAVYEPGLAVQKKRQNHTESSENRRRSTQCDYEFSLHGILASGRAGVSTMVPYRRCVQKQ